MKTILATAYAVNPNKGSEDGMGWNFILQIARFNRVIAITRENNRAPVEAYMLANPNPIYNNIQFHYFDLPYWMRFWKKGGRGAMVYYSLWQRGIVAFVRRKQIQADIVHNLNFHNDWTPSFLWKLNKPFVWGPIGHHPFIPKTYLGFYSWKAHLKNISTWCVKQYFWQVSPSLNQTRRHADHVLCMNSSVPGTLGLESRYSILPSVATNDGGWIKPEDRGDQFTLISAGRFVALKGFDLTLRAFAGFYQQLNEPDRLRCKLKLIGSGPEESKLRALAHTLGIGECTEWISWLPRTALMEQFQQASAFLFPSHEGAGMVVAEALSFGLPVICLDNEGPGQFIHKGCGTAIPKGTVAETLQGLTAAITELYCNPAVCHAMSYAARKHFENQFHWDRRGEKLEKMYQQL